jgi:hypothetical protein
LKPYYIIFIIVQMLLAILTNNKNKRAYTVYLLGETLRSDNTAVKHKVNSAADYDPDAESEGDYNSRALLLEQ